MDLIEEYTKLRAFFKELSEYLMRKFPQTISDTLWGQNSSELTVRLLEEYRSYKQDYKEFSTFMWENFKEEVMKENNFKVAMRLLGDLKASRQAMKEAGGSHEKV